MLRDRAETPRHRRGQLGTLPHSLKGLRPREKRNRIGKEFIAVFCGEAQKLQAGEPMANWLPGAGDPYPE